MKFLKRFYKTNDFPIRMLNDFYKFSSRSEKLCDFGIPAVASITIALFLFCFHGTTYNLIKGIPQINNQVLTSISILAGFNIASISVLATINSDLMKRLFTEKSNEHQEVTLFKKLMTFFSAAVTMQFIIILIGIAILIYFSVSDSFEINSICVHIAIWSGFLIWVYVIFVSILISLRNLKTLFTIIVEGKDGENKV